MSHPSKEEYKELLTDIILKQVAILGPDIAITKAQQVSGLKVDKEGKVLDFSGDEQDILQQLVDKYIQLSGQIVRSILEPVFQKYPSLDIKIK